MRTGGFAKAKGFPLGGSCRQSRLMRGRAVRFEMFYVCIAPKPPLCKGRWHGEAVTKGLCSTMSQIGAHQCESVQSAPVAVGEGFYPSRAGCTIEMVRTIGVFVSALVQGNFAALYRRAG